MPTRGSEAGLTEAAGRRRVRVRVPASFTSWLIARKARRARFTDSESGKWGWRAGSMIATLVPLASRLVYLPRMPLLKSRLGRGPSGSGLADFFILFSLSRGGDACADKACAGVGF